MSIEDRRSPRRIVNETARIIFSCGDALVCTVRNVSRHGAQIVLHHSRPLPPAFELEDSSGDKRPAKLVWQLYSRLGVQFTDWGRRIQKTGFGRQR